jgi:hypothetical protein
MRRSASTRSLQQCCPIFLRMIWHRGVGHQHRLLTAITELRAGNEAPRDLGYGTQDDLRQTVAERRQISVMFCDIADSTALSTRFDPEDLSAVIRGYQSRVATTIALFDGFIARYVGDGVLIYFGWPKAREGDAERAVRAALDAEIQSGPYDLTTSGACWCHHHYAAVARTVTLPASIDRHFRRPHRRASHCTGEFACLQSCFANFLPTT